MNLFFRALVIFGAVVSPIATQAAAISLHALPASIGVDDAVSISITIDGAIPTNAFSGRLSYPSTLLEPIAISDGNSIVPLWITHPKLPNSADSNIPFAGIVPGGFSGTGGKLFSVLFRAKRAGTATLSVTDIEVLRNDGKGSREPTTARSLSLVLRASSLGGYTEPPDTTPPEPFTPYLGADTSVFGGDRYLVFSTVDKGSGLDHYAVAESRFPAFLAWLIPFTYATATSPYRLADESLSSTIYVKAIDRAGNMRLAVFPPQRLFLSYVLPVLFILIVVALLFQMIRRRRSAPTP